MSRPLALLTLGEVADGLHLVPETVRRWAELGKLEPVALIGDDAFYSADQALHYARFGCAGPKPALVDVLEAVRRIEHARAVLGLLRGGARRLA